MTDQSLRELGEKLQQSIVLTKIRLEQLPPSRVRVRGMRTVEYASKLFVHVSQVVQAAQGLTGFMQSVLNISVDDLFNMSGYDRVARCATGAGIAAVSEIVRRAIDELAEVNSAIDKGMKNGETKPA